MASADDDDVGRGTGRKPVRGAASRRNPLDSGFERWLDRKLHDLYDPILNEAIPDDLARLLDQFDERPAGHNGLAGSGGGKPDDEG